MATDPGVKLDKGKPRVWNLLLRYFPRALLEVADVSEYGANKYCEGGWEGVDNGETRYKNALARHFILGTYEDVDEESGLLHDAQVAWNALASLELRLRRMEGCSLTLTESGDSPPSTNVVQAPYGMLSLEPDCGIPMSPGTFFKTLIINGHLSESPTDE